MLHAGENAQTCEKGHARPDRGRERDSGDADALEEGEVIAGAGACDADPEGDFSIGIDARIGAALELRQGECPGASGATEVAKGGASVDVTSHSSAEVRVAVEASEVPRAVKGEELAIVASVEPEVDGGGGVGAGKNVEGNALELAESQGAVEAQDDASIGVTGEGLDTDDPFTGAGQLLDGGVRVCVGGSESAGTDGERTVEVDGVIDGGVSRRDGDAVCVRRAGQAGDRDRSCEDP